MKAKLEIVDSIRQAVEVEVSTELVKAAQQTVIEKMKKEVKVPGFRKGKIPNDIIMKKFGEEVQSETMKQIVQDTYPTAVTDAGANPISPPSILPLGELEDGKPFKYKATFEIYPEVEPSGYTGLSLERDKVAVADDEVEMELKKIQQQMTQLEPSADGKVGEGMVAMIDFKGTAAGEVFPGSEAENYVVDFGSGNLLKEFEVQIEGMKANEEREIEFHYPQDYFRKEIAGKKGKFSVKTKEVRKKIVPELNDDFAKEMGKFKNLKEVRTDLKKRIKDFKEQIEKNKLMEQAIRALIDANKDMEVPTALIDSELGNMLEQIKKQYEAQGLPFDDSKINAQEFVKANVEEASNRARGYMLVSAIAKKEEIQVTDEDLDLRLNQIAEQTRQPLANVKQELEKKKQIGQVKSQLIFEKTLDFVVSKSKVKETKPKKAEKAKKASK
ncbi:MAG: trigger factor [Deltaproteobacteria bacterium]|jgi:trigger factor|nr:trigger factor [Deltaproteobacteria bacterium]